MIKKKNAAIRRRYSPICWNDLIWSQDTVILSGICGSFGFIISRLWIPGDTEVSTFPAVIFTGIRICRQIS